MASSSTLQSLYDALGRFGDRPAIVALQKEGTEIWSYRQLSDHIGRLSAGFAAAGLRPGDGVAFFARNQPAWIIACLGAIRAGGVAVPVDAQLGDEALRRILRDSDPRFLFTTADEYPRVRSICGAMSAGIFLLDAEAGDPLHWRRLLASGEIAFPAPLPEEPATLFYTSGTTGSAKGVPLTHRNIASQLEAVAGAHLVTAADRVLLPLPLHHVYPFVIGMLVPLSMGLPVILPHGLTGPQVIRAIHAGGATVLIGVPRLYAALCSHIEERIGSAPRATAMLFRASLGMSRWLRRRHGLRAGKLLLRPLHRQFGSQLRIMASGGAPLDPELAWKLEVLGWQVAVGYGLTETSPLLTLNPPGTPELESVGQPIPGVEIRIEAASLPAGSGEETPSGEVLARGAGIFSGYRNLPAKTAEAFTADGWFRTGDIGYFDQENYLHLTGRLSSLIVTEGGENIQPEDVEDAYLRSPLIGEIGVLQKDGRLVAVIVPELRGIRAAATGTIGMAVRDAVHAISKELPSYQRVSDFVLTHDPLARTRLGKIRRHLLPAHYEKARAAEAGCMEPGPMSREEMSDKDRAALEDPAANQVWNMLARRYHEKRLTLGSSPQLDLGVDSMEWLNLTLEIRQCAGVELAEQAIARIETVRDLLHEVSEAHAGPPKATWLDDPESALSERQLRWLKPQSTAMRGTARLLYALDSALCRTLFQLRVKGLELLPSQEPFVLIPNHLSFLDPPILAAAIGYQRMRDTYWGGWTGVMTTNPINRLLSRLAQVVPIDPDRALFSSLAFGAAVLKRGKNLVWFPEGGISRSGSLRPFKTGIGLLLERFETLAVPVAIGGTGDALPPGNLLPRPGIVTVEFGQPLRPLDLEKQGSGSNAAERITEALRGHVLALQSSAIAATQ